MSGKEHQAVVSMLSGWDRVGGGGTAGTNTAEKGVSSTPYTHTHTQNTHTPTHEHTQTDRQTNTHTHTHTDTPTHTYTHTHAHRHTHTQTHTHIQTHISASKVKKVGKDNLLSVLDQYFPCVLAVRNGDATRIYSKYMSIATTEVIYNFFYRSHLYLEIVEGCMYGP